MCLFLKTTSTIKCVSSDTMNPRWTPTQMISSFGVPVVIEKDPVLQWQPGWCSQYCGLLLTLWSGDQIPVGVKISAPSRTTPVGLLCKGYHFFTQGKVPRVWCWCQVVNGLVLYLCACIGMSSSHDLCHYQYYNIVCVFFFFEVCHISMKNLHFQYILSYFYVHTVHIE